MTTPSIAIADDAALPACLALLPMLATEDALILVARDADGTLTGAAGVLWRSWGVPGGFPAWVHVLPDRRRQGIGRALLDALAAATVGETGTLIGAQPIAGGGDGAAFADAVGAVPARGHHYFEMHIPAFHADMTRLVDRLTRRGHVPADARIEPLTADNAPAVIALIAAHFAVAPPAAEALVARALVDDPATAEVDRDRTCVALVGDAVAGVLVARRKPGARAIDIMFRVVAPGWRGGWINAFLMERFLTRMAAAGAGDYVSFDCVADNRDTLSLAARSAARTLRVDGTWRYALASAAR